MIRLSVDRSSCAPRPERPLRLLVAVVFLIAARAIPQAGAADPRSSLPGVGEEASQIDGRFPEADASLRPYVKGRRVFRAYRGRGRLIVANHGLIAASLQINGQPVSLARALARPDGRTVIDIGRYTVDGDNALKLLDLSPPTGSVTLTVPYPELVPGRPADAGFSEAGLRKVEALIRSEVAQGFPGAVLLIVKNGRIVEHAAFGHARTYDGDRLRAVFQPMTTETMFDLASNTKMFATVLALMKLTSDGRLDPDDLVSRHLPEFTGQGRETIRLSHLLSHCAGFGPEIHSFDPAKAGAFYSLDRATTLAFATRAPLTYATGTKTRYSDTDFILLGAVIERVTGRRLDEFVEGEIYRPLGLTHTLFNPLRKGFAPDAFAASERNGNTRDHRISFPGIRTRTIQGEVHDEKAWYSLGGVAGHAGLFSRASDLAVLAQLLLNGGGYGGYRLCGSETVTRFTRPGDRNPHYGLGWDKSNAWEFGPYVSDRAFGHTGWVGTFTCIEPQHDLAIVLLTNKVHSPMVAGEDRFVGNGFETGRYGGIATMIYEALLER